MLRQTIRLAAAAAEFYVQSPPPKKNSASGSTLKVITDGTMAAWVQVSMRIP